VSSSSLESRPRTIAFFSPELVSGGTQRHLLEVLKLIDRTRFTPLVIAAKSGGPLGAQIRAANAELVELHLGSAMLSRDMLRCVREAADVLRSRQVGIVQYFEWRSATIALLAARRVGGCRIVAARRSVPKERGAQRLLAELVVRTADRVVVNAELLRPNGRAGRRTAVIPSGVDTDRFQPTDGVVQAKTALGLAPDRPVIGTVGRLEPRKGTATLLAAFAALRDRGAQAPALVVVGDGPLRDELAREATRLGIASRVKWLGDVSDVRPVLEALDVFVLPSRTEGMSNALLEAMAMALPVVATAVGGTPEVVADGQRGLLVPADDSAAMATAITRVLDDRLLASRLGAAARQIVEEKFGAKSMVRALEGVYAAVASSSDEVDGGRVALVSAHNLDSLEECR
jgi:glycosyltransferase involved in cell wall biosynthesis